jgi:uncharacterized membrane protein
VAALAYLVLPISGMTAYFLGTSPRTRFHGMQAVIFGLAWSVLLLGCSAVSALATQAVFVLGGLAWLVLLLATAVGRDLRLPIAGSWCAEVVGLDSEEVD